MTNYSVSGNLLLDVGRYRTEGTHKWRSPAYVVLLAEQGNPAVQIKDILCTQEAVGFHSLGGIRLSCQEPCVISVLQLRCSELIPLLGSDAPLKKVRMNFTSAQTDRLRTLIQILLPPEQNEVFPLSQAAALLSLVNLLFGDSSIQAAEPAVLHPLSSRRQELCRKILRFIHSNLRSDLRQSDAAAALGVSPQYIGKVLHDAYGLRFTELVCRETALMGEQIRSYIESEQTGNISFPGSPVLKEKSLLSRTDAVLFSGTSENAVRRISVTMKQTHEERADNYRRLINLGYAQNLRHLEMESTIRTIQRDISFSYGRICRITDLIYTRSIGSESIYDYRQVFDLLNILIENHLTPFLELGNKTLMIHETTGTSFNASAAYDPAVYYDRLLTHLPGFLKACINRYGREEVEKWQFEISYMYTDTIQTQSFGFLQYLNVFRKIRRLIREYCPGCCIGGPGFNDWSGPAALARTIELMEKTDAVPDFFSAYLYPVGYDMEKHRIISLDPAMTVSRLEHLTEALSRTMPGIPVWITEFNSSLSSRNLLNDSHYQAVWLTWMAMAALRTQISGLGYYLLSDAPLHYQSSLDFLFGGWGLLSERNIPKPSYHAFRLLSMLEKNTVYKDDCLLCTAGSQGSLQLLLFRYRRPRQNDSGGNITRQDLASPETLFEDPGTDSLEIFIHSLLPGTYVIRKYRIDEDHSSLFKAWQQLGYLMPRDEQTLAELASAGAPQPEFSVYTLAEDEPFVLELKLKNVSMCLVTLDLYSSGSGSYM